LAAELDTRETGLKVAVAYTRKLVVALVFWEEIHAQKRPLMLLWLRRKCPVRSASSTTRGISPLMIELQQRRAPVSSQVSVGFADGKKKN
jgi:hypothetical protein